MKLTLKTLVLCGVLAFCLQADEKLQDVACRSVHLGYPAPEGVVFYNEITPMRSARGTYFCSNGFNKGYFGIQELYDGKKLVIFSVWDPGDQNDPNSVKDEQRVKLLHQGEGVRIGRFGNEGTGGQSFFDYDWQIGQTYRFAVTAARDGDNRTAYSGHFFHPEDKKWKHLVTFSTLTGGTLLGGYYSFVEDFRRNRVSATQPRTAQFSNGWVKAADGSWHALTQARFTADSNPVTNINAGVAGGEFFLATGGDTTNVDTPLREMMELKEAPAERPQDLQELAPKTAG